MSRLRPLAPIALAVLVSCTGSLRSESLRASATPPRSAPSGESTIEEFRAAHEEYLRDARGYRPMIELRAWTLSDASVDSEPGEFDLARPGLEAFVPIPVSRDTFVIAGLHAGARSYDFTGVDGAEDEQLYNLGLRLGIGRFFDDDSMLMAYWQPSVYSDLDETLNSDDYKLWYGTVLGIERLSDTLYAKGGVRFTDARNTGVLPLIGVSWHFDPRWQLDVLFPRNAEVLYEASKNVTLHAGFDSEAEEYHLRHTATGALAETNVRVHEIYGFLGAIYRAGRNLSGSIRVGASVYGAYDWDDGGPTDYDGDLEPGALYLRLGVAWDF